MKIATITLNPALDLTVYLDELRLDHVNLAEHSELRPAGKGINVAMVLRDLGCEVTVTGWLGSENPTLFERCFAERGMVDRFIRVAGATRTNVHIAEPSGRVTDLNMPGLVIDRAAQEALLACVDQLCLEHEWFVLSSSLPKSVPPSFYCQLIERLKAQGKSVIFDSSGAALTAGIAATPTLIKPNREELSQWGGKAMTTVSEQLEAARRLLAQGVREVVISDGERGLIWCNSDGALQAIPPAQQVVSTVGAGDSLVAGFALGLANGDEREVILRRATAASVLAVTQTAVGFDSLEALNALMPAIKINQL